MTVEVTTPLRERKRRETASRITRAALALFAERGFESTTIDAIAAEAGISRRTFFHYFKAKDDILLGMHESMGVQVARALSDRSAGETPLHAVRAAALRVVAQYPLEQLIVIDRLMRASATVQASKQASYAKDETILFEALKSHWPDRDEIGLRMLAVIAIGIGRSALDAWSSTDGQTTLSAHVEAAFDAVESLFAASA